MSRLRSSSITDERTIPKFARSELTLGNILGRGGFSIVLEVKRIQVDEVFNLTKEQTEVREEVSKHASADDGYPKFAVKMLRDDLLDEEHAKGVIDLAVEARLLKRLSHPNIVTMRATANSDPLESRFFIILEILNSTLDDRITYWRRSINKTMSIWCGPFGYCCANKKVLQRLWIDRMDVMRKLASALAYLHSRNIIYRDLKPENIGFDEEGQVKIFDFGLAKRLYEQDMLDNGLYRLTGNTGSLRYMAPEVALNQFYNLKADSYSFAMVFWQICSLQIPFAGYNVKMHADYVLGRGYRPKIELSWPDTWGSLIRTCWDTNINARYDFDEIYDILNREFEDLNSGISEKSQKMDIKAKKKVKEVEARRLDVDTRKAFSDGEISFLDNAADKEIV